jgi:hypothetical protein
MPFFIYAATFRPAGSVFVHSHLKVRLDELGMGGMAGDELLHEALVGGLGEPTLLVHQRHDSHRLKEKTQVYS